MFGEQLVTSFLFEVDYTDEPRLPSPEQLKYKVPVSLFLVIIYPGVDRSPTVNVDVGSISIRKNELC